MGTVTVSERTENPRSEPRSHTDEPSGFGKVDSIRWKLAEPGSEDQHRAAQIQHAWAVQIRHAAESKYGSLAKYAETFGLSYDRLTKILRGVETMRLEDIAQAERLLHTRPPQALVGGDRD
jgi:hypothetical protein